MKRTIKVRRAHINKGVEFMPDACPIFLAAKAQRLDIILAQRTRLVFTGGREAKVPPHVSVWMRNFDAGKDVKPITFEIEIVKVSNHA